MKIQFSINFSGLIAFVPNTNGKAVRAVFADGTCRHQINKEELFVHHAFIHFSLSVLDPMSPRRPDLTGNGHGICFLQWEDLVIGEQPTDPELVYSLYSGAGSNKALSQSACPREPVSTRLKATVAGKPPQQPPPGSGDLYWALPLGLAAKNGTAGRILRRLPRS